MTIIKQSLFLDIWQLVKWLWTYHFQKKLYYIIIPTCNTNEKIIHTRELNYTHTKDYHWYSPITLTITKICIFGLSNLSVKHIQTHVNDLNSGLPFSVNTAVCQLNQWHICCHSSVSRWNLHVLSALCRHSGKTVVLRHPHTKPWTLIMNFW